MHKINIVCVGSLKEKFYKDAQDEYLKRLKKFCQINIVELQEHKLSQNPSRQEIEKSLDNEYSQILPFLKGKVIVLAVEGKQESSEDFCKQMFNFLDNFSIITFVIGSSYGLSQKIKKDNYLISFSQMTLPHHLVRIMLEWQIYRAYTIKNNITYHK